MCFIIGSNCHVTEEVPRAQEKAWKPAEETGVPQVEPEDLEDELAQIKAEIKKLMYEVGDFCYMKCLVFGEWLSICKSYFPIKSCQESRLDRNPCIACCSHVLFDYPGSVLLLVCCVQ